MTQELICGVISGLDSMGRWQGWFLDARRCSAEKGGLQGSVMGVGSGGGDSVGAGQESST